MHPLIARPRGSSGSPHSVEEMSKFKLQAIAVSGEGLRCGQHLGGRRAGFSGALLNVENVGRHMLGERRA